MSTKLKVYDCEYCSTDYDAEAGGRHRCPQANEEIANLLAERPVYEDMHRTISEQCTTIEQWKDKYLDMLSSRNALRSELKRIEQIDPQSGQGRIARAALGTHSSFPIIEAVPPDSATGNPP